jgi:integrase
MEAAWWIVLPDTKSERPDHRLVPTFLTGPIERYLEIYWPVLLRPSTKTQPSRLDLGNKHVHARSRTTLSSDTITALWISRSGGPLTYDSVRRAITETTRVIIGVPVSPHLFRAAGATSAALHAPRSPHLASALLQHSDPRVTEEHYNRASSLSVALDFTTLVRDL